MYRLPVFVKLLLDWGFPFYCIVKRFNVWLLNSNQQNMTYEMLWSYGHVNKQRLRKPYLPYSDKLLSNFNMVICILLFRIITFNYNLCNKFWPHQMEVLLWQDQTVSFLTMLFFKFMTWSTLAQHWKMLWHMFEESLSLQVNWINLHHWAYKNYC